MSFASSDLDNVVARESVHKGGNEPVFCVSKSQLASFIPAPSPNLSLLIDGKAVSRCTVLGHRDNLHILQGSQSRWAPLGVGRLAQLTRLPSHQLPDCGTSKQKGSPFQLFSLGSIGAILSILCVVLGLPLLTSFQSVAPANRRVPPSSF